MTKHRNYSRMSTQNTQTTVETAPVVEDLEVAEDVEVIEPDPVITGVVTGCTKLNVRIAPSATADVACTIECLDEVVIDEKESTDTFYKICTATGIEGFCMKKYITTDK